VEYAEEGCYMAHYKADFQPIYISEMHVKNFKSLRSLNIRLKPITILLGPNSSGKTSLIQTLLLIKQTLESGNPEIPLVINGKYLKLGTFKDIVFLRDLSRNVSFAFKFNVKNILRAAMKHEYRRFPLIFDIRKVEDLYIAFSVIYNESLQQLILSSSEIRFYPDNLTISYSPSEFSIYVRENHEEGVPKSGFIKISSKKALDTLSFRNFLPMVPSFLFSKIVRNKIIPLSEDQEKLLFNVRRRIAAFVYFLEMFLTENVKYLGPLREYPQRYYLTSGEVPKSAGIRGERAIELLYYEYSRRKEKLDVVRKWLKKFNLASDVIIKRIEESLFELRLEDISLKTLVNICDVGFGASQLLPIIIECFLSRPGSFLIVEQPEIHLHPSAQACLADLFIESVRYNNNQLLIETHSEHLLIRLQRRIAEGVISKDDVSILYFKPTNEGTKVYPIEISELGTFKEVPEGFFEEDISEIIGLIKALKSRRNKNVYGG